MLDNIKNLLRQRGQTDNRIKVLETALKMCIAQMDEFICVKGVDCSDDTPHGFSELNGIESAVAARWKLADKANAYRLELAELKSQKQIIDCALSCLPEVQREICTKRYVLGYEWFRVAGEAGYSERNCQRVALTGLSALKKILKIAV